jgi:hypothetical protein
MAGTGWYVLVTWPNGEAEHVSGFGSALEAKDWIKTQSQSWLKADGAWQWLEVDGAAADASLPTPVDAPPRCEGRLDLGDVAIG